MTKTYIIIDLVDVTQTMIDVCHQSSFLTLRKNVAEDKTILKWTGETPAEIVPLALTEYTSAEILVILNNPVNGWIVEEIR